MTIVVRTVETDAELGLRARIVTIVSPSEPTTVEEMRWADRTYPGNVRFLADLDGATVGTASVGRIYVYEAGFDAFWGTIDVLPEARRRGVGSQLLDAIRDVAALAGKSALHVPASERYRESIDFLIHRGFVEYERSKSVHLSLVGRERPDVVVPDGIRLTSLAAMPGAVEAIHAVAEEALVDIPGGDRPMDVGDLAEFRARDVDRDGILAWGFILAIEESTETLVGYASIQLVPGSTTEAWHHMTAVARRWRHRGVAGAMKRATIGAAIDHGLTDLGTYNDESNAAMQAVNARLGYEPLPDELTMRGPVARGIMGR